MNPHIKAVSGVVPQALDTTQWDVLIDLWQMDFHELGDEMFYYYGQVNELNKPVVWQGQTYEPLSVKAEEFETTSWGAGNHPTLTVSNIVEFVTMAAEQPNRMIGVAITHRQTYAEFLGTINFQSGKNPTTDATQETISRYLVERLLTLTAETATLELAASSGSDGVVAPARAMLANTCRWKYRGEDCGYMRRATVDHLSVPTDDSKEDMCSGTLTDCRARFGATAVLPFGGFPPSDKAST